jgi:hypothetical protein
MSQIEENVITNLQDLIFPQEIKDELADMIRARAELGLKKYGITLADNPAPIQERLQHAIEELLDAANYLQWIGAYAEEDIEIPGQYQALATACELLKLKNAISEYEKD